MSDLDRQISVAFFVGGVLLGAAVALALILHQWGHR